MPTAKKRLEEFERKAMPDAFFEKAKVDFRDHYSNNFDLYQSAEKAYRNLVVLLLKQLDIETPHVVSRVKERNECIKKFDGKYREKFENDGSEYKIVNNITDLIGVRTICLYESDLEKVAEQLTSQLHLIERTDKSKLVEAVENEFGYKGIHLDLSLDAGRLGLPEYTRFDGLRFEVQIRTIVQDAWSEVDHKLKYKSDIPPSLRRRIYRLAALFELADQEFESIRNESVELERAAQSPDFDEARANLDTFGFQRVAASFFPGFGFHGDALDGVLPQIKEYNDSITVQEFRDIISANIEKVFEYRDYMNKIGNAMSPYTVIRHCCYLSNSTKYVHMIFDGHRKNFDRWLEHGTVFPYEIS